MKVYVVDGSGVLREGTVWVWDGMVLRPAQVDVVGSERTAGR